MCVNCAGLVKGNKRVMGNTCGLSPSIFMSIYVPKSPAPASLIETAYLPFVLQLTVLWKLLGEDRAFQQEVNLNKYFKMDIYSHRNG